jgi:hypothetical protein
LRSIAGGWRETIKEEVKTHPYKTKGGAPGRAGKKDSSKASDGEPFFASLGMTTKDKAEPSGSEWRSGDE